MIGWFMWAKSLKAQGLELERGDIRIKLLLCYQWSAYTVLTMFLCLTFSLVYYLAPPCPLSLYAGPPGQCAWCGLYSGPWTGPQSGYDPWHGRAALPVPERTPYGWLYHGALHRVRYTPLGYTNVQWRKDSMTSGSKNLITTTYLF